MPHPLDNPFFNSLQTRHRAIRLGDDGLARYPADVAPFMGVASTEACDASRLAALVPAGDTVLCLGRMPNLPAGWSLQAFHPLAQMVCEQAIALPDGPEIIELDQRHQADILALTALVYPHYFRQRTTALGRYFGIYLPAANGEECLAAMIGERLGTDDTREMSAICTHPDFLGRGLASRLTAWLSNDNLQRGLLPFLHVSYQNQRALALYQHLGYRTRADLAFAAVTAY